MLGNEAGDPSFQRIQWRTLRNCATGDQLCEINVRRPTRGVQYSLLKLPALATPQDAANVVVGKFRFDCFQLFEKLVVVKALPLKLDALFLWQLSKEVSNQVGVVLWRTLHVLIITSLNSGKIRRLLRL